ncbi:hypothetical protein SUDANB21_00050 [Streptomyces sp. enrichment culture]
MRWMGDNVRSRWAFVVGTMVKHPWLPVSWVAVAALTVVAQKIVPQPWDAGFYGVSFVVSQLLFSLASARDDGPAGPDHEDRDT